MNSILKISSLRSAIFYLSLFLLIFSVRLIILHNYGSSTPYFDDWDMGVFIHKYANNSLGFIDWLTPAYQHLMLPSKITNVLLFEVNNQQWDTLNTLMFNSFLWSSTAIFFIYIARQNSQHLNSTLLITFILVLWLLPLSIISATWSIVTHYYFMMAFMVIGYWGIGHQPYSKQWLIGLFGLLGCSLTIGAGAFVCIPLVIIYAYRLFFDKVNWDSNLKTFISIIIVCALAFSSMLLWKLAEDNNTHYLAKDVASFVSVLTQTLAWPLTKHTGLLIVSYSPVIILAILLMTKFIKWTPLTVFTLSLAAYMIMQDFGIAYVRNDATGINPAVRYYEFLSFSIIANFIALLVIQRNQKSLSWFNAVFVSLWLFVLYSAIPAQYALYEKVSTEEVKRRSARLHMTRSYIGTQDINTLIGYPYFHRPYPRSHDKLANWLDQHKAQNTLAMELQIPPVLMNDQNSAFVQNASIKPIYKEHPARYYGENVMGSYNLQKGAQNATGRYESQIFKADRPYIMIPTLGFLGLKGLSLEVVNIDTGHITPITPDFKERTAEVWQSNYIALQKGSYKIRAVDDSKQLWFAFAAPREVGRLSYYSRLLIRNRSFIWNLGFILLLITLSRPIIRLMNDGSNH